MNGARYKGGDNYKFAAMPHRGAVRLKEKTKGNAGARSDHRDQRALAQHGQAAYGGKPLA
jgi:hypothetical protein